MAHFAKLDANNIVVFVTVGRDEDDENELTLRTGDVYKRTSFNTRCNVHLNPETNQPDGGIPFRGNYAGIGYIYDAENDVFYPPQPYPSWSISASTNWTWTAPVVRPNDGKFYDWDEQNQIWNAVEMPNQTPVQHL